MIVLSPSLEAHGTSAPVDGVPEPIVEVPGMPMVQTAPRPVYPSWYPLVDTNEHEAP